MGRPLPLARQRTLLYAYYPHARCDIKRGHVLQWKGHLKPMDISRDYLVRMKCERNRDPRVWVVDPELQTRNGKNPPHLYKEQRLCLYFPKAHEWDASMPLATTIVPWASEWLLHYEVWLATGDWTGGGTH